MLSKTNNQLYKRGKEPILRNRLDKHWRSKFGRVRNLTEFLDAFGDYYKQRTGDDLDKKKYKKDYYKIPSFAQKREFEKCIYCGAPLHEKDENNICSTCYKMKFGDMVDGEIDEEIINRKEEQL